MPRSVEVPPTSDHGNGRARSTDASRSSTPCSPRASAASSHEDHGRAPGPPLPGTPRRQRASAPGPTSLRITPSLPSRRRCFRSGAGVQGGTSLRKFRAGSAGRFSNPYSSTSTHPTTTSPWQRWRRSLPPTSMGSCSASPEFFWRWAARRGRGRYALRPSGYRRPGLAAAALVATRPAADGPSTDPCPLRRVGPRHPGHRHRGGHRREVGPLPSGLPGS